MEAGNGQNLTVIRTKVNQTGKVKHRRKKKQAEIDQVRINYLLIRDAIVHSLKVNKRAPTMGEIAAYTGLSVQKLNRYKNENGGFDMEIENLGYMMQSLTPDVMLAIYARATGNGHTANADAKLWLELQHGWISPTEKAKLERMPTGVNNINILQNGGTVNFISAIPDKEDGKP